MSFQVKFGSEPSLSEGKSSSSRGRRGPKKDAHDDSSDGPQSHHHQRERGRGRGGRGRGGRGRGGRGRGGRGQGGAHHGEGDEASDDEENVENVDSDGGSSERSGSQGQEAGGKRHRRRGRGRGKRSSHGQKQEGDEEDEQPVETSQKQEVHIHYHVPPVPTPSQHPGMQQPCPQSYPYSPPPYSFPPQAPPPFNPTRPMPPASYTSCPPPMLGSRPIGMDPRSYHHPPPTQPYLADSCRPQQPRNTGMPSGSQKGSQQNLTSKSGKDKDRESQRQTGDAKKTAPKAKPDSGKADERPQDEKNKQLNPQSSEPKPKIPELDPDEWIKIFNLLLHKFQGRTKLGTLLSQKGELFKGLSHSEAAAWLRHSNRFLTFERDGQVKFVSVCYKDVRSCFKYKKHHTDKCENAQCPFFHICRDFVSGCCLRGSSCHFNHSFHAKGNAKICTEAGLQAFTDEEIRTILFRNTPAVCSKFNKGGCTDECPDLHVCAKYIRKDCSEESCKFGHAIKESEHNRWILDTFHMQNIHEKTLQQVVLVPLLEGRETSSESNGVGMKNTQSHELLKDKSEQQPQRSTPRPADVNKQKTQNRKPVSDMGDPGLNLPPHHDQVTWKRIRTPQQEAERPDPESVRHQKPLSTAKMAANEGARGEGGSILSDHHYAYLCEQNIWTGTCSNGYMCAGFHGNSNTPPYLWQLKVYGNWQDFSSADNVDIEKNFCGLAFQEIFEVVLDVVGGLQVSLDFNDMVADVLNTYNSELSQIQDQKLEVRRRSTRSYTEADKNAELRFYTQWLWFRPNSSGILESFKPGTLQYTLEKKYNSGQQKYYFEIGEERFLMLLQEMNLINLNQGYSTRVVRRPVFVDREAMPTAPLLSPWMLSEPPLYHHTDLPPHWSILDSFQDFEMIDLDSSGAEYQDVVKSFHSTVHKDAMNVLRVFRVQNPALWDKYCSMKRSMTPRDAGLQTVDERKLFHGTPTLLAARGICANNMDFRRAGENTGALFGRGSYFSTQAFYSLRFTSGSDRYMFLAKVLVGKFTQGKESYTSPPVREGLKLYDSCVDSEANPTIFVIFDLAQSYPEYLIQFEDTEAASSGRTLTSGDSTESRSGNSRPEEQLAKGVATLSVSSHKVVAQKPVPAPRSLARPTPPRSLSDEDIETQLAVGACLDNDLDLAANLNFERLKYSNPYSPGGGKVGEATGGSKVDAFIDRSQGGEKSKVYVDYHASQIQALAKAGSKSRTSSVKKSNAEKCLIS